MPAPEAPETGSGQLDAGSLAEAIRSGYQRLSPSERQVADAVLASPAHMTGFTATELARSARVSKATVTRFVAKLGLGSFEEFRRTVRGQHTSRVGSPLQLMEDGLAATHGDLYLLVEMTARNDQANLAQTYRELPAASLVEAVRLLCEARAVVFAGFRKQYALAHYATTLFQVIRPQVRTLPLLGASAVDGMLDVGAEDLVVMFPFRRPTRDQDVLSRAVVEAGAGLLTIGDIWPSPASGRATVAIRCRTDSVGVFDSLVTPVSLINLLFAATANQLGDPAQSRLALLEDSTTCSGPSSNEGAVTYSIAACDGEQLGVATASHWLAAGALVVWAEAGVGAVATQAFTQPHHLGGAATH